MCYLVSGLLVVAAGVTAAVLDTQSGGDTPHTGGGGGGPTVHNCTAGDFVQLTGDSSTDLVTAADTGTVGFFQHLVAGTFGLVGSAASAVQLAWNGGPQTDFAAARIGHVSEHCDFTPAAGSNVLLEVDLDLTLEQAEPDFLLAAYQNQTLHLRGSGNASLRKEVFEKLVTHYQDHGWSAANAKKRARRQLAKADRNVQTDIAAGKSEYAIEMTISGGTGSSNSTRPIAHFYESTDACVTALQESTIQAICTAGECVDKAKGHIMAKVFYTDTDGKSASAYGSIPVKIAPG